MRSEQRFGCESTTRASAMVEDIGKDKPATFSVMRGRAIAESRGLEARSFTDATGELIGWLRERALAAHRGEPVDGDEQQELG